MTNWGFQYQDICLNALNNVILKNVYFSVAIYYNNIDYIHTNYVSQLGQLESSNARMGLAWC